MTTPALALAAAVPRSLPQSAGDALLVPFGVVTTVALIAVSGYRVNERYGKETEDWRAAAAYVVRESRPGDRTVVAPDWAGVAYSYYDPERTIDRAVGAHRTFIVASGSPDVRLARLEAVTDRASGQLGSETPFGGSLGVRVFEPPR